MSPLIFIDTAEDAFWLLMVVNKPNVSLSMHSYSGLRGSFQTVYELTQRPDRLTV